MKLLWMQVNLGLSRPVQSEDLLGVGSWLLLQDKSDESKDLLRSEISQLFGQLSMLNVLINLFYVNITFDNAFFYFLISDMKLATNIDKHCGISMQKLVDPSLKAFSEEVYYKSKEFGIYDVRTSIAFYNLSHVFHHLVSQHTLYT